MIVLICETILKVEWRPAARQGVRAAETLEQMGRLDCVHTSESFMRALGYSGAGTGAGAGAGGTSVRPLERWDTAQPAGGPPSARHRPVRRQMRGRRHSVADAAVAIARRLSSLQMWSAISPEPTGGGENDESITAAEAAAAATAEAAAGRGHARAPPGWVMAEVSGFGFLILG